MTHSRECISEHGMPGSIRGAMPYSIRNRFRLLPEIFLQLTCRCTLIWTAIAPASVPAMTSPYPQPAWGTHMASTCDSTPWTTPTTVPREVFCTQPTSCFFWAVWRVFCVCVCTCGVGVVQLPWWARHTCKNYELTFRKNTPAGEETAIISLPHSLSLACVASCIYYSVVYNHATNKQLGSNWLEVTQLLPIDLSLHKAEPTLHSSKHLKTNWLETFSQWH